MIDFFSFVAVLLLAAFIVGYVETHQLQILHGVCMYKSKHIFKRKKRLQLHSSYYKYCQQEIHHTDTMARGSRMQSSNAKSVASNVLPLFPVHIVQKYLHAL